MATGNNVEMMVSVVPGTMSGLATLNSGLASINNSFMAITNAISENFGLVNTAIVSGGALLGQFGADAMNAAGQFEQSMKIVQMVSGQNASDIALLGQKANEFAVQYRTDIDQITEGLQTLGRAGLNSANEQTEVLQNGLSTAKLEGRELNGVLEELIQNTSLLGGDMKSDQFGEQSKYVNDLMVATSMSAPIDTHDVSETLKYSGGIAYAAGANIESDEGKETLEDYMGTVAAFAQKGVTGSIAGTALRAFLNKPATQDNSVKEGLAAINMQAEDLWEDGGERMKPISEQIALINKQMDEMDVSKMDRLQIWSKIVGGKMGQQMLKLDSKDIQDLTKDIEKAQSAESLANESMKTFQGNINEISQKGQAAFRQFGQNLIRIFNPVVSLVNKLMDLFNNPVAIGAFTLAFMGAMRLVASRIKMVISEFTQGGKSVIGRFFSGQDYSIREYEKGKHLTEDNKSTKTASDQVASDVRTKNQGIVNNVRQTTQTVSRDFQNMGNSMVRSTEDMVARKRGAMNQHMADKSTAMQRMAEQKRNIMSDKLPVNRATLERGMADTIPPRDYQYRLNYSATQPQQSRLGIGIGLADNTTQKVKEQATNSFVNQTNKFTQTLEGSTQKLNGLSSVSEGLRAKFESMEGGLTLRERLGQKISGGAEGAGGFGSTLMGKLKDQLFDPRTDRTIGFANKGLGKLGNVALNASDFMGGPLMVAMMGLQVIITQVQQMYQEYTESLKDAKEAVDDAYKKRDEYNNNIAKEYQESGITGEELDSKMGDIYSNLEKDMNENNESWRQKAMQGYDSATPEYEYNKEADDGSTQKKQEAEEDTQSAIDKNTAALYAATGALRMAMDKLVTKMSDTTWGMDGLSSQISDKFGAFQDGLATWGEGSQFSDEGSFLKTASQKDSNYAGYTELAGLMLEDLHDAKGDWEKGFQTLLGSRDSRSIINTMSDQGRAGMQAHGNFVRGLSRADNSRLQQSMMRNKQDWQGLAKEMAKYENKTGKVAGKDKTGNKRLEKLVSKLATETGLKRSQVLQAASLQQLQDMYEVAQGAIVPTMSTAADAAVGSYQTAFGSIAPSSSQTANETADTDANAAAIASMLSVIAQQKAIEASYQQALINGETNAKDVNEYLKEAAGTKVGWDVSGITGGLQNLADEWGVGDQFREGLKSLGLGDGRIDLGTFGGNQKEAGRIAYTYESMAEQARHPDWSQEQIHNTVMEKMDGMLDSNGKLTANFANTLGTVQKNYADAIQPTVKDAYLASQIGEEDNDQNAAGDSGSGGGDGDDKDSGKGSKKERVDLVLCNKKEIPKLNVNLFKKPPSFTVLNKNFKLRDIKVNTQDKPKAVLSSIKNAIIDVQKRTDPKIIQDETAEYDPAGATDGTNVPSGSSSTGTDG